MNNVPPIECHACKRDIGLREDRWWLQSHIRLYPLVYCTDCVELRPWLLRPEQSLLTHLGDRPDGRRRRGGRR